MVNADSVHGAILAAADSSALAAAVESAAAVVTDLIRQRTPVADAAAIWSAAVRDAVTAASTLAAAPGHWYVSGSTARDEALPGSDVETLLVGPAEAREAAPAVLAILEQCGLRADDKGAIASRARFCRSAEGWTNGIAAWTADPAADRGIVMAGLLADARPITDGPDLRGRLGVAIRGSDRGLSLMLTDALAVRAHLPSRMRLFGPRDDRIDVKAAALQPITSLARWAGLSCGSAALATRDRLRDAAGTRFLDADDAAALAGCFAVATRIRWGQRHLGADLTFGALSPQDRAALRGVGRELDRVRRKLTYLASTSSFTA